VRDTLLMLYGVLCGLALYPGLRDAWSLVTRRKRHRFVFTCNECGLGSIYIRDRLTYDLTVIGHLQYHNLNQTRRS